MNWQLAALNVDTHATGKLLTQPGNGGDDVFSDASNTHQ
jgi:hypothetical protein